MTSSPSESVVSEGHSVHGIVTDSSTLMGELRQVLAKIHDQVVLDDGTVQELHRFLEDLTVQEAPNKESVRSQVASEEPKSTVLPPDIAHSHALLSEWMKSQDLTEIAYGGMTIIDTNDLDSIKRAGREENQPAPPGQQSSSGELTTMPPTEWSSTQSVSQAEEPEEVQRSFRTIENWINSRNQFPHHSFGGYTFLPDKTFHELQEGDGLLQELINKRIAFDRTGHPPPNWTPSTSGGVPSRFPPDSADDARRIEEDFRESVRDP